MANTTVISKLLNNNVEVTNLGAKYILPAELRPFLNKPTDDFVELRHADGTLFARFLASEVLQVVRQDTTVIPINDASTLYDELATFFFELSPVVTPLIPDTQRRDTFALLPPAGDHTDEVWYVRQQTGVWLLGTFRASGLYRSDGVNWVKNNEVSQFFVDNFMTFKDDVDPTKTAQFQLSAISSGQNRVFTFPDQNGIFALLSQVTPKLDSVVGGTRITIDVTDPNNPIVNVDAATDAEISANTALSAANAAAIAQEILDRIAGDTGSVSIHSDMDTSGAGANPKEVLANDGADVFSPRTLQADDLDDIDTQGFTEEAGDMLVHNGTEFIPIAKTTFRSSVLQINNTAGLIDKLNENFNVKRLVPHKITISYSWSLNDGAQDLVSVASFGGLDLMTALTDNTEVHRQEPKDTGGADPDGRGTNQRQGFHRTFFVTPVSLGNNAIILQFAGSAAGDLASIWECTIEIEECYGIVGT